MYKVRFHLAEGVNYKKWQVKHSSWAKPLYYDPDQVSLEMLDCKLVNHPTTAKKIFNGKHKSVCAWVECTKVLIHQDKQDVEGKDQVSYNPKIQPNWVLSNGHIMDKKKLPSIVTDGRKLFCLMSQATGGIYYPLFGF